MKNLKQLGKQLTRRDLKQVNGGRSSKAPCGVAVCSNPVDTMRCLDHDCVCTAAAPRCVPR